MLIGKTFRLYDEILAIETQRDGTKTAVTIPVGETFRVVSGAPSNDKRMVQITWQERTFLVFAEGIERRSVEVLATEA